MVSSSFCITPLEAAGLSLCTGVALDNGRGGHSVILAEQNGGKAKHWISLQQVQMSHSSAEVFWTLPGMLAGRRHLLVPASRFQIAVQGRQSICSVLVVVGAGCQTEPLHLQLAHLHTTRSAIVGDASRDAQAAGSFSADRFQMHSRPLYLGSRLVTATTQQFCMSRKQRSSDH